MATPASHHNDAHDAQLALEAELGGRAAFTELFRRHAGPAWRLALAVGRSTDVAERAVGDGFTHTLVRLSCRATTLAVPFRIHATRASGEAAAVAAQREGAPVDAAPNAVVELFRRLPERWRGAVWLTVVEGGTPAQAAPVLGVSPDELALLAERGTDVLRGQCARSGTGDLKSQLAALVVPIPVGLEKRAVSQWEVWQQTREEQQRELAIVRAADSRRTVRVVSAAAAGILAGVLATTVMVSAKPSGDPSGIASEQSTGNVVYGGGVAARPAPPSPQAAATTPAPPAAEPRAEPGAGPVVATAAPRRAASPTADAPQPAEKADSPPPPSPEPEPPAAPPAPADEPPANKVITADPGGGLPPISVAIP